VNQAIVQMDQVTQQNAALVEEAAAAADSMQQQARELQHAVAVFRLSGQGAAAVPGAQAGLVTLAAPRPPVRKLAKRSALAAPAHSTVEAA
jgi:hypothetical protein